MVKGVSWGSGSRVSSKEEDHLSQHVLCLGSWWLSYQNFVAMDRRGVSRLTGTHNNAIGALWPRTISFFVGRPPSC
eukprot:scaffold29921_cov77-Cyclotella_meneghiniana.AAC.1